MYAKLLQIYGKLVLIYVCSHILTLSYSTREIFDIIVDYPDSEPALNDLKVRMSNLILGSTC